MTSPSRPDSSEVMANVFGFSEYRGGQEAAITSLLADRSNITVSPNSSGEIIRLDVLRVKAVRPLGLPQEPRVR